MNWCEACERPEDSDTCTQCGANVGSIERAPIPWRWRLFLVATVIYVIWRIYQLVNWLT
ncbi:unannotated protein [freshwater metagenome]|uniref:Unannotated protein n=1 Tax=freshwater metagenome TaxID=449393 RepID=A0A6J6X195_9ZZZZ